MVSISRRRRRSRSGTRASGPHPSTRDPACSGRTSGFAPPMTAISRPPDATAGTASNTNTIPNGSVRADEAKNSIVCWPSPAGFRATAQNGRHAYGRARPGPAKVLATVVNLLETTLIRASAIAEYARSNKSYGLTTLEDRHVSLAGSGNPIQVPRQNRQRVEAQGLRSPRGSHHSRLPGVTGAKTCFNTRTTKEMSGR